MEHNQASINHETLLPWPLVVIVNDGYIPELADYAIEAVREFHGDTFSLVWGLVADRAREEMELN